MKILNHDGGRLPEKAYLRLCRTAAVAVAAAGLSLLLIACTANKSEGSSETGSTAASGVQADTGSVSNSKSQGETAGGETGGAEGTLPGTVTTTAGGDAAQQTDPPSGKDPAHTENPGNPEDPKNPETSTGARPTVTEPPTPTPGAGQETESATEPAKPAGKDETSEDLPVAHYDTPDEIDPNMPDSGEDLQTGKP